MNDTETPRTLLLRKDRAEDLVPGLLRRLTDQGLPREVAALTSRGQPEQERRELSELDVARKTLFLLVSPLGCLCGAAELAGLAIDRQGAVGVIAATARNTFSVAELDALEASPVRTLYLTHHPLTGWHDRMVVLP